MFVNSICGSVCTCILVAFVAWYTYLKIEVLIHRKDVDVLSAINEYHYEEDHKFDYVSNGFNIAAAFTAYDTDTDWILDPRYGELTFKSYHWGPDE